MGFQRPNGGWAVSGAPVGTEERAPLCRVRLDPSRASGYNPLVTLGLHRFLGHRRFGRFPWVLHLRGNPTGSISPLTKS